MRSRHIYAPWFEMQRFALLLTMRRCLSPQYLAEEQLGPRVLRM